MADQEHVAERLKIVEAVLAGIERREELFAAISTAQSGDEAMRAVMALLGVDQVGADAVLDLQVRRFSALGAARIRDEYEALRNRAPRSSN